MKNYENLDRAFHFVNKSIDDLAYAEMLVRGEENLSNDCLEAKRVLENLLIKIARTGSTPTAEKK